MKQITLNETTKNQVREFVNEIIKLNDDNITFYIPISNENEIILDELDEELVNEYNIKHYYKPVTLDESKKYLKVYLTEFNFKKDEVDEKVVPAVIDAINQAIDDYNKQFEVS